MAKNHIQVPKFITDSKTIWAFLGTLLLLVLAFFVTFQPASYMRAPTPVTRMNVYIFTVIVISCGFALFVIGHFILYLFYKRHRMEFFHIVIWFVAEVIIVTVILTVIVFFIGNEHDLTFSDMLWHVFVDFLAMMVVPYIISVLLFALYENRILIDQLKKIIEDSNVSLPSEGENLNFYDRGGKLAFSTRRSNVLFIEAADNYCNIHYLNDDKEDMFILHNSMKQLDSSEDYNCLVRCHRGYMVNVENVKLLRRNKDGLLLELSQGNHSIPVSRTYNSRVVKFFVGEMQEE